MTPFIDECRISLQSIPRTLDQQLFYLNGLLDRNDLSFDDRQWLNRKIRSVRKLRDNPSPRQRIVGNRRGRISKEDQEQINLLSQLTDIRTTIEAPHVKR